MVRKLTKIKPCELYAMSSESKGTTRVKVRQTSFGVTGAERAPRSRTAGPLAFPQQSTSENNDGCYAAAELLMATVK